MRDEDGSFQQRRRQGIGPCDVPMTLTYIYYCNFFILYLVPFLRNVQRFAEGSKTEKLEVLVHGQGTV
jgi:hypothetical protein